MSPVSVHLLSIFLLPPYLWSIYHQSLFICGLSFSCLLTSNQSVTSHLWSIFLLTPYLWSICHISLIICGRFFSCLLSSRSICLCSSVVGLFPATFHLWSIFFLPPYLCSIYPLSLHIASPPTHLVKLSPVHCVSSLYWLIHPLSLQSIYLFTHSICLPVYLSIIVSSDLSLVSLIILAHLCISCLSAPPLIWSLLIPLSVSFPFLSVPSGLSIICLCWPLSDLLWEDEEERLSARISRKINSVDGGEREGTPALEKW